MIENFPYIDDFCDDEIYVLSTLGKGPKGDKGDKGDVKFPEFADPITWDPRNDYAVNTIVDYHGSTYISKKDVPHGIDIGNSNYWQFINGYNAQIEQYRQEALIAKETADESLDIANQSMGLHFIDIRNDVIHDLQLVGSTFQAMTLIDGVLYYNIVSGSTGYLYSVPINFSRNPEILLQLEGFHAYTMGSLNAHTIVITYSDHYMLYDITNGTYEIYDMPMLWGFCCDRKTADDSRIPDLCVAFDSMNNGIYRYAHLHEESLFQPVFTIPTAPIGGHAQDVAAYGFNVFELLIGTPGVKRDDVFAYNYLYMFNANTANMVGLFPIICENEIEGITITNLTMAGNVTMYLADVTGKIYETQFKVQPNALSAMFAGQLKQHPLNRINANNVVIETVKDSENNEYQFVTRIKMGHMVPTYTYMHYHPYLVNMGSRCNLYFANLGAMYTYSTNGMYCLYNRLGTSNTYRLASITSSNGTYATFDYQASTINKTFAQMGITGNSILPSASEASNLPDLSFEN